MMDFKMMDFNSSGRAIRNWLIFSFTLLVSYACVEPFEANVSASQVDLLIVDGYINIGPGETRIMLSKVSKLDQEGGIQYEEDADVHIENDDSEAFLLNETDRGIYTSGELNLPANKQYRLYIKLSNGKEYRSELQTPKITPPIDSVHWEYKPDLIYIYANAHDTEGDSRYYRWTYQEDWQIRTPFQAFLKYDESQDLIVTRADPERIDMNDCYRKVKSNKLIFGTTAVLQDDVIKFPVTTIPHNSERTSLKYSIIVKQHALTQDEFNYLTLMNKNTTQTGSFFDPMPSQLFGNINRINNATETVIGYVGVYTTEQITKFILKAELPPGNNSQLNCTTIDFEDNFENRMQYLSGSQPTYIPYLLYNLNGNPVAPMIKAMPAKDCMDCQSDDTGPRPDYW